MQEVVVIKKELFDVMKSIVDEAQNCCGYSCCCDEHYPRFDEGTGEFSETSDSLIEWGMHSKAKVISEQLNEPTSYQVVEVPDDESL